MPYADPIKRKQYHDSYNKKWYQRAKNRYKFSCLICGKEKTSRYKQIYCSLQCVGQGHLKDNPKYKAIHAWINSNLPRKMTCSKCFITTRTHWANISGNYRRELSDWIELCPKCHGAYDKLNRTHRK